MRDGRAVLTVDEAQTLRPIQGMGERMFENVRSYACHSRRCRVCSFAGQQASGCIDLGGCAAGA